MNQTETANRFIDAMLEAEGKLKGVKEKIDERKAQAQSIISRFAQEQEQIIDNEKENIKSKGSQALFEDYRITLKSAIEEQKKMHTEYIKGTEFITKFEETFIVSVFGKVKSGKSYLGNFIMGTAYKKRGIATNYDKLGDIPVTVYDKGKLSQASKLSEATNESEGAGFGVASTEATSTIQYFRIGGLTWFDTPGIGSITKENEQLAEEYIKNSDLVVFAMNSDAAGTTQEISELKSLYEMNKPMLILCTQSDTTDYDCDDDGNMIQILLPKSDKDRTDTENYLIQSLHEQEMDKALELSGGKILTISTKLAVEALKDPNRSDEMYQGSNLELFINRLIEITTSKAAELKEKNPKDRFNKLIAELEKTVNTFENKIRALNDEAAEISKKAVFVKKKVIARVKHRAMEIIHDKIQEHSYNLKAGQSGISGSQIAAEVSGAVNSIIKKECSAGFSELIPDIRSRFNANVLDSNAMNISDMSTKKVTISYEVEVIRREKVKRGMFGKIGNLFFGEKYTTTTSKETRNIEFEIGDNSTDIEEELLSFFEDICANTLEYMIQDLVNGCVKPFENIYRKLQSMTVVILNELEKLKIK